MIRTGDTVGPFKLQMSYVVFIYLFQRTVPLAGITVTVLKVMVCRAVIGTMSTSDPAPAKVLVTLPKYTVVSAADWEATTRPVLLNTPVPWMIFAESDAR